MAAIYCCMLAALCILCCPRQDLFFILYKNVNIGDGSTGLLISRCFRFSVQGVAQLVNFIQGVFSLSVCAVVYFWPIVSMEEYECQQSDDFCVGSLMIPAIKLH